MAKQTKPKTKRTQVKDLKVEEKELSKEKADKVKGGSGQATGKRQHLPVRTRTYYDQ